MGRLQGIAAAMVVVISASANTHFSINAIVSFPCTISASMNGTSAVTCPAAQNTSQMARVSYVTDSNKGDMIMTVEF